MCWIPRVHISMRSKCSTIPKAPTWNPETHPRSHITSPFSTSTLHWLIKHHQRSPNIPKDTWTSLNLQDCQPNLAIYPLIKDPRSSSAKFSFNVVMPLTASKRSHTPIASWGCCWFHVAIRPVASTALTTAPGGKQLWFGEYVRTRFFALQDVWNQTVCTSHILLLGMIIQALRI